MFTLNATRDGAEIAGGMGGGACAAPRFGRAMRALRLEGAGMARKVRRVRPDLDRRRREALTREFATRVTEHARWLPPADLALLNWVYRSERPLAELAATGVAPGWVLHRRLNRIVSRVLSPEYRHVVMLLSVRREPPAWPPEEIGLGSRMDEETLELVIGRAIFVHGETVREVARVLGLTRRRVARIRELIVLRAEAREGNGG